MAGITLTIEVDDKGTVKVKQFADESKKAFDQMQKGPQAAQGPLDSLKESWIGLTAKVAAATAVIYGVKSALSSFVNEAAEAEQIENRLRYALEITGYTWQYAKQAVDQFANSVQASTRFSDEQARQALTDMMLYTNDFAKAQMGAKLAMDMYIRTGQDLGSTSRLIGMAMSGNVEMLGRYIPELKQLDERLGSNATMAERSAYAMKVLQEKFGGTAQADVKTYAGIVAQFKNAWSDFKEEIGTGLLPVLKETFKWLTDILRNMEAQRRLQKEAGGFWSTGPVPGMPYYVPPAQYEVSAQARLKAFESQRLAAETKPDVFPGPKEEVEDVLSYSKLMYEAWKEFYYGEFEAREEAYKERQWWLDYGKEQTEIWMRWEKESLEKHQKELLDIWEERQWWTEYGKTQEETGAKWEAKEIAEGLERSRDAYEEWKEWYFGQTNEMQAIWQNVGQNISNAWASNIVNIIRSTESGSEKIKSLFQSIGDVFLSTVSKMITQWLIFGSITGKQEENGGWLTGGLWSGLLGSILKFKEGGIVQGWQPIKQFQHGGLIDRPTLGLIGEGGAEAVVPLKGGKIPIEGKTGGDTYIITNINAIDTRTFEEYCRRNPGAILQVVNHNARSAGTMKNIIRGT